MNPEEIDSIEDAIKLINEEFAQNPKLKNQLESILLAAARGALQVVEQIVGIHSLSIDARFFLIYLNMKGAEGSIDGPAITRDLGIDKNKIERIFSELSASGFCSLEKTYHTKH